MSVMFQGGPMDGQEMPEPAAGGMPPELAALLGGGGAPPGAAPPPEEAPKAPADVLREMLAMAESYRSVEKDDEDLLEIEKATTILQSLLAKQQQERDQMMQGKASPRGMRRASGAY